MFQYKEIEKIHPPKVFTTSNGTKLEFSPEPIDIKQLDEFKKYYNDIFVKESYPQLTNTFFLNKLYIFSYYHSLMIRLFGNIRFKKALDIGAGNCCFQSFLKAKGLVDRAISLDTVDRREKNQPELMRQYIQQLISGESQTVKVYQIQERSEEVGEVHDMVQDFPGEFVIDEFVTGDYLSYKGNGYDLVTSFSSLDFFHADDCFKKTREIMDSGVLFVIVSNWNFFSFASTGLMMDKPFMQTYLTVEDLKRYYKEIRPEIYPYVDKCLYIKNEHFTIEDYKRIAEKNGFNMVYYSRPVVKNLFLDNIYNVGKLKYIKETVLPNAINPYLDIEDLFAKFYIMVFQCT